MSDILIVIATALQNEVLERSVTSDISEAKWAPETDLILPAGGTKPLLTNQTSLVRSIVHDAIENMRAMLMFNHAFPDSALSSTFAKDSLLTAAEKQAEKGKPGAAAVHSRLQHDVYHLAMIINLVSFIIAEMARLMLCNSHAPGSHFCGVKLRSAAMISVCLKYWPSVRQVRSPKLFVCNCQIIPTHIRLRQE
jgi:hypothetical protein